MSTDQQSHRQRSVGGLNFSLDTDSFTPLYIQVANGLKALIDQKVYTRDQQLPSENELVDIFGISRITATAALDELVNARLAYRKKGRGTFVAHPVVSNFSFFTSFTEDMLERGLEPSSKLLSLTVERPDAKTVGTLKITGDDMFYCLTRVRLANDEPVVLQYAYLPQRLFPDLQDFDFEATYLFQVMRNFYDYKPTWAEAVVEASAATSFEARNLEVKPRSPVLTIWHLTLDDQYVPLEYVRSVYRSDRFSFATGRNALRGFR